MNNTMGKTNSDSPKPTSTKPQKRCSFPDCKKKLSLIDREMGKCLCTGIYCIKHRSETSHNCTFNWGSYQKQQLTDKLNSEKCVGKQIEVI